MSHWLLEGQEEMRQQALNLAQHVQNSHELADEKLIRRAADVLEMVVLDLVFANAVHDGQKQRQLQLAAADAFCLLCALPRPADPLAAGKSLLRAGSLAVLGDKGADAAQWLKNEPWAELPIDSENWPERTWATVLDVWLRLIRQDHYADLNVALERISRLRDAQPDFEKNHLAGREPAHAKVVALELIGLYHLAKAAEILVGYMTDEAVDGKHQIRQSLDTHFGQVLAVCEHARMIDLEVLGRLLAASAVQIAQKRELARTRRSLASQTAEKATTYMLDQTYKAPLRNRTDSPMLPDQVAAWAAAGESETLELKRSTGQRREAAKSICAMLNHRGGRVLFGVEPNGQVVGQEVGDRTLTDIAEEIAEIDPPAFPSIDRVDLGTGRQVLIVSVLTGQNRPYSYRGQAYRRVGATDRAMSRAEYNRLLLEQVHSEHRWENESASGWTVADLNQTEIVRTVEEAIRRGRAEDPGTHDPVELLRGLGLLHEDRLLRAAVVLFGRAERLEMFYPQCLLRVARFRGVDRTEFLDNRQMFGNAFDLLRKAELFLRENLPIAGRITPSLFERLDDPLYPPVVLREALANAFCHRDYSIGGGSVAVAVYDDKLEITSSGALHFGLTAEALFAPHESLPWNPLIARVFYRRGLIEAWGRGTLKMAELIEKAGLPKLAIEDAGGCVTVRFRPPLREEREITQRQREVLAILEQFSTTGLALREILSRLGGGATERQVRADLEILRSAGLAVVEGRGRGARWKCL